MTTHQVLSLVGLIVLGTFLFAVGWEFAFEDLVASILFSDYERGLHQERWEYVITATSFIGVTFIIPTLVSLKIIFERNRAEKIERDTNARLQLLIWLVYV